MISIVIPLYNKVSTVNRAIKSILSQSFQDFEIIVVDDGSTDNSVEEVMKLNDERIHIIRQDNCGVSSARNRGIEESRNKWVTFLDADDEWMPDYLNTISHLRKKYPHCDVYATAYYKCNNQDKKRKIILNNIQSANTDFLFNNYFKVAAKSDPPIHASSICVRKEALQAIGGFPQGVHQGEDLLTWARLAADYKIAYCCEPLSIFHTGETSTMGKPKRIPADDDPVGQGLEEIYSRHPDLDGIRQYIAHWHKMRASIYLRLPESGRQCRSEIRTSRQWHRNKRLIYYQILSYIPYRLRMKLINHK